MKNVCGLLGWTRGLSPLIMAHRMILSIRGFKNIFSIYLKIDKEHEKFYCFVKSSTIASSSSTPVSFSVSSTILFFCFLFYLISTLWMFALDFFFHNIIRITSEVIYEFITSLLLRKVLLRTLLLHWATANVSWICVSLLNRCCCCCCCCWYTLRVNVI